MENYILDPIPENINLDFIDDYIQKVYSKYINRNSEITPDVQKMFNVIDNFILNEEITLFSLISIILYNSIYHRNVNFTLNNVKLSNSSVHNKGVFASRPLKRGDIITLYPQHVIFKNRNKIYFRINSELTYEEYIDYSLKVDDNLYIAGFKTITNNSTYLGHMINDCSSSRNKEIYENEVLQKLNAVSVVVKYPSKNKFIIFYIATKDIEENEEIFSPYGHGYWRNR